MHFEYDGRGNLVRKRTPAGEQEYEWDGFNRLLSARVVEASRRSQSRYFYDAFGRRIAKEVNGEEDVSGIPCVRRVEIQTPMLNRSG
nr:RHS repeat domain-containing protein [Burkholderia pyrrocinia]